MNRIGISDGIQYFHMVCTNPLIVQEDILQQKNCKKIKSWLERNSKRKRIWKVWVVFKFRHFAITPLSMSKKKCESCTQRHCEVIYQRIGKAFEKILSVKK